mgnify:CR=1 FL=1|tara:strand:+ start:214 stop:492 length:279 start_codon:yes stop_codon:yes gene_type:complete
MASINFKPTRDWVVLPMQRKDKTDSGIELVGGAENSLRTNILKVIAAGPQCQMVKEGDTVMIHPNSEGLVINLDEGEFVMVNEFTICGVIPD